VDRDLPLEHGAAARQVGVERHAEVTPVDRGRDREGDAGIAAEVGTELTEATGRLDLTGLAVDLQLTGKADGAVVGDVEAGRAEGQLREALGVEEFRRHQVTLQLGLVDVDRLHGDGALELRLLAAGQGGLVGLEAAAEGGDVVVGDREGNGRVDRVDGPAPGRDALVDGVGAHFLAFCSFWGFVSSSMVDAETILPEIFESATIVPTSTIC